MLSFLVRRMDAFVLSSWDDSFRDFVALERWSSDVVGIEDPDVGTVGGIVVSGDTIAEEDMVAAGNEFVVGDMAGVVHIGTEHVEVVAEDDFGFGGARTVDSVHCSWIPHGFEDTGTGNNVRSDRDAHEKEHQVLVAKRNLGGGVERRVFGNHRKLIRGKELPDERPMVGVACAAKQTTELGGVPSRFDYLDHWPRVQLEQPFQDDHGFGVGHQMWLGSLERSGGMSMSWLRARVRWIQSHEIQWGSEYRVIGQQSRIGPVPLPSSGGSSGNL